MDNQMLNSVHWTALLFFVNIIYCYGGSILDSFVVYTGWKYLDPDQFLIAHQKQSNWIIYTFVFPLLSATVLNILLLIFLPAFLPLWPVIVSLCIMVFNWLFSSLIQIPIHRKLNAAFDPFLFSRLTKTNYVRVGLQTVQLLLIVYLMALGLK